MVKINNSFDNFTKTRITDAYIRNLHDYRVAVEIPSLSVVDYLISIDSHCAVIPCTQFERLKSYINYLNHAYHKRLLNFICTDDKSSPLNQFHSEFVLIANLLFQSKKNYSYCLGDLIDFCWDAKLSLKEFPLPKTIIYMSEKVRQEFHKYCPQDYETALTNHQSLETKNLIKDESIHAKNTFKNPQNLYLKLLEEIIEKAINYSLLQFYDFLLEETSQKDSPFIIKSNNLIQIWDELNFICQTEYSKPSLKDKIVLMPFDKNELDFKQDSFNRTIEEWTANLNRALELKIKLGIDFIYYLNTHSNTAFYQNFYNHIYPSLNSLVSFIQRKMGINTSSTSHDLVTRNH